MAGATSIKDAPYPTGDNSTVTVRLGGYVPDTAGVIIVETYKLPWDATVIGVDLNYTKLANDLDGITLKTVDATALTLCTIGDLSADVAGVAQTLHADIIGTNIVKGNKIQLKADGASGEEGNVSVFIHLRPTYG